MEVAAFYRFVDLDDLEALRFSLYARAADLGLKGTVLLAAEGLNGGLCGGRAQLDAWLDELRLDERFRGLPVSYSYAAPWQSCLCSAEGAGAAGNRQFRPAQLPSG